MLQTPLPNCYAQQRADFCLFGGSQLLQREGGRPHGLICGCEIGVTPVWPELLPADRETIEPTTARAGKANG